MDARTELYRDYLVGEARTSDGSDDVSAALFAQQYLVPVLSPLRGRPIVEIGAGSGRTLAALRERGFTNLFGVDISPSQVGEACRLGVQVELGDGLDVLSRQQERTLGAVIALDVLEHLTPGELINCIKLISSRLGPNGRLLFRVPNGAGLFCGAIRYGDLTHQQAFTKSSAYQLLRTAGMEPEMIRPCRPLVHGFVSAARYCLWRGVETILLLGNAAESGEYRDCLFTRNVFISAKHIASP